jgi:WD40 repeat protein
MQVTLKPRAEFTDHQSAIREIAVHPDGRLFLARSNEMIVLYDLAESRKVRGFYSSMGYDSAAFGFEGKTLVYETEEKVHYFDLLKWQERMVVSGELCESRDSDVSSAAGLVADGDESGKIAVRRIGPEQEGPPEFILEGHEGYIECVRFHPSGALLASGGSDMTVRFWDLEGRKQIAGVKAHEDFVTALAFSPDGSVFISGDYSGRLKVWDFHLD